MPVLEFSVKRAEVKPGKVKQVQGKKIYKKNHSWTRWDETHLYFSASV